ncbi:MAG: TolC family protein [Firmicutes bacterium]|nr:TolC family protein [Bacillota bacterium]
MRRFILVILAVVVAACTASGEEAPLFTMEEAVAIAQRDSIAAALADLTLEEARLAYMEVQANQILRPSVIAQQQGEDAWEAAQAARQLAELDLALQVEQAYYDVLRTDLSIDLAKRALEQAEAQLESTQVRHGLGMVSDVDLLAAQSQVATAQLEVNRAEASGATARMRFNRLLGRELDAPFRLVDEFAYEPVDMSLEEALTAALNTRIELKRARAAVALREKELMVNDNEYTPSLTIAKSRLALERAEAELREREIDIILEVRQNYQAVREGQERIPILETNLARAQETLRITGIRYEAGVITAIDLIDAQRAAFQAELQLIQGIFDYNIALARFYRSAGLEPR